MRSRPRLTKLSVARMSDSCRNISSDQWLRVIADTIGQTRSVPTNTAVIVRVSKLSVEIFREGVNC